MSETNGHRPLSEFNDEQLINELLARQAAGTVQYPPGTVGIVTGELTRYSDFGVSLRNLKAPYGSRDRWARSCSVVTNLAAVTAELHGEWLWVIGDDHTFRPDIIQRLLDRNVDIVAPLCLQRQPPYKPVIYSAYPDPTAPARWDPVTGESTFKLKHEPRVLTGGRQGLVEVDACGNAGMLIRKRVFDSMPSGFEWWQMGQIDPTKITEDLYFCHLARKAGFSVYIDTELAIGHIGVVNYWPGWKEDGTIGVRVMAMGRDVSEILPGAVLEPLSA